MCSYGDEGPCASGHKRNDSSGCCRGCSSTGASSKEHQYKPDECCSAGRSTAEDSCCSPTAHAREHRGSGTDCCVGGSSSGAVKTCCDVPGQSAGTEGCCSGKGAEKPAAGSGCWPAAHKREDHGEDHGGCCSGDHERGHKEEQVPEDECCSEDQLCVCDGKPFCRPWSTRVSNPSRQQIPAS
jgi:hypothetical protein